MIFGHPRTGRLERWLDGGEDSITDHIQDCDHCATRLESLISEAPKELREALLASHRVPAGLHDRLSVEIDDRMRSRADLTLLGELFSVPMRTAKVMSMTNRGDQ